MSMDLRQIAYVLAIEGKVKLAQEVHQIIDEENLVDEHGLRVLAEGCGVNVSTDMTPMDLFQGIIAVDQYAKFN